MCRSIKKFEVYIPCVFISCVQNCFGCNQETSSLLEIIRSNFCLIHTFTQSLFFIFFGCVAWSLLSHGSVLMWLPNSKTSLGFLQKKSSKTLPDFENSHGSSGFQLLITACAKNKLLQRREGGMAFHWSWIASSCPHPREIKHPIAPRERRFRLGQRQGGPLTPGIPQTHYTHYII